MRCARRRCGWPHPDRRPAAGQATVRARRRCASLADRFGTPWRALPGGPSVPAAAARHTLGRLLARCQTSPTGVAPRALSPEAALTWGARAALLVAPWRRSWLGLGPDGERARQSTVRGLPSRQPRCRLEDAPLDDARLDDARLDDARLDDARLDDTGRKAVGLETGECSPGRCWPGRCWAESLGGGRPSGRPSACPRGQTRAQMPGLSA